MAEYNGMKVAACPYCTSERSTIARTCIAEDERGYQVHCICCCAQGPECLQQEIAIILWNRGSRR